MARKKVKLELISNDSSRRATFKKRKKGLVKKVSELSTLCDVKACLIVYGQDEPTAEVWPSLPDAVRVLRRLKRLPEMEQSKKMMNQEAFVRQRIMKLQEQLRKHDKDNRELETTLLMYQCLSGRSLDDVLIEDVTSLAWLIEMKLNKVREMLGQPMRQVPAAAMIRGEPSEGKKDDRSASIRGKAPMDAATEEDERREWFPEELDHGQLLLCRNQGVVHPNISNRNWMDAYYGMN